MADSILNRLEDDISELVLIPSSGGRFEVIRDDTLIFSKKALGRHANVEEVVTALERGQPVTE